jgi:adenylyltransferase/sulfurtransferase
MKNLISLAILLFTVGASAQTTIDLQGHRGARGLAPENTLPGFALAMKLGVTTLELDVVATRDGVLVISHDPALNPDITIVPLQQRLSGPALDNLVAGADVVLDCSDNFATRHAINRACVRHRKPLVSGAAIRFDGQVSVYDMRRDDSPCYHCLFPEGEDVEEVRCAVMGVFAPLTGIVGTVQAAEALKLVAGIGEALTGRLLLLDALEMEWRTVKFRKDSACAVCSPSGVAQSGEYLRRLAEHPESATGACRPASPTRAG